MKTGVVGYGVAAQFMHLPFIITNPDYQLLTILQRHGDQRQRKISCCKNCEKHRRDAGRPDAGTGRDHHTQ